VFIVIRDYIKVYLKFAKEWCFATVCVSQDIQRQYWLNNLIFNNWNKCILVDRYICIYIYIYIYFTILYSHPFKLKCIAWIFLFNARFLKINVSKCYN